MVLALMDGNYGYPNKTKKSRKINNIKMKKE